MAACYDFTAEVAAACAKNSAEVFAHICANIDAASEVAAAATKKSAVKTLIQEMSNTLRADMERAVRGLMEEIDGQVDLLVTNAKLKAVHHVEQHVGLHGRMLADHLEATGKRIAALAAERKIQVRKGIESKIPILQEFIVRMREEEIRQNCKLTTKIRGQALKDTKKLVVRLKDIQVNMKQYVGYLLSKYELQGAPVRGPVYPVFLKYQLGLDTSPDPWECDDDLEELESIMTYLRIQ